MTPVRQESEVYAITPEISVGLWSQVGMTPPILITNRVAFLSGRGQVVRGVLLVSG
jgi:hypothetical protein